MSQCQDVGLDIDMIARKLGDTERKSENLDQISGPAFKEYARAFQKHKSAQESLSAAETAFANAEVNRRGLEARQRAAEINLSRAEAYMGEVKDASRAYEKYEKIRDALEPMNDTVKTKLAAVTAIARRMGLPTEFTGFLMAEAVEAAVAKRKAEAEADGTAPAGTARPR